MIAGLVIEEAGIGEEQRLRSVGHEIGTRTGGVEARRGGTGSPATRRRQGPAPGNRPDQPAGAPPRRRPGRESLRAYQAPGETAIVRVVGRGLAPAGRGAGWEGCDSQSGCGLEEREEGGEGRCGRRLARGGGIDGSLKKGWNSVRWNGMLRRRRARVWTARLASTEAPCPGRVTTPPGGF